MAHNYKLIDYFLTTLTEMLMKKRNIPFDQALSIVVASKTYASLVTDGNLLDEGDLFVFEKLEKEISSKR